MLELERIKANPDAPCPWCGQKYHDKLSACAIRPSDFFNDELGAPTIESELEGEALKEWKRGRAANAARAARGNALSECFKALKANIAEMLKNQKGKNHD